jgi:ribonuclease HIII
VRWLAKASEQWGMELGKGVSAQIKAAATAWITRHDRENLGEVAKLHFKTAKEV